MGTRLDGWKEIAAYLGRAERTVKRWEADRSLPTNRVPGKGKRSVYAFTAELDEWFKSSVNQAPEEETEEEAASEASPNVAALAAETKTVAALDVGPMPRLQLPDANAAQSRRKQGGWLVFCGSLAIGFLGSALLYAGIPTVRIQVSRVFPSLLARSRPGSQRSGSPVVSETEQRVARDLYLKGRYEWSQRTPDSLNRALDAFTQAIVHDPGYAKAYAGLADTYDLLYEYSTMPEHDAYSRAIAAARKAVELDDSLAEGHRALAFAEMYGEWKFADAEKEFRRAIELNPTDPEARKWYANAFAVPGRYPESLEQISKAQELDPSSHSILADKGLMLFDAGRAQEGIEMLKEVERSAPGFRAPHSYLMVISLESRDYSAFLEEGRKAAESANDPVLRDIMAAARVGYAHGSGRALLKRLYDKEREYFLAGKIGATLLAETCVQMGRKQEALQLLEEAYDRREMTALACLSNPALLTLRDEPKYKALVRKINFPALSRGSSPKLVAGLEGPLLKNSN